MFRTTTKSLLLAGALATASITTLALADGAGGADAGKTMAPCEGHEGMGHRMGGMGHHSMAGRLTRHAQELGLTAQQLTAIQAAEDAAKTDLEKLHLAVRAQRDALEAGKGNVDQMKAAHHALHDRREALRSQIEGILSPEQRTKLKSMRGGMRHGRPVGGPPKAGQAPAQ